MLTTHTTAHAHGLDGRLVEPDWPPLSLHEVQGVLHHWPQIEEPFEIVTSSPRPFSAASVIKTGGERVFLKRHHPSVRDVAGLREEHRFLQHLRAHGVAVPEVLADGGGITAFEEGKWTYEAHSVPPGIDLYGDALSWTPFRSVVHAHSAGAALARLHCASAGFDAPRRPPRPLVAGFTIFAADDPSVEISRFLSLRPALHGNAQVQADACEALELLAPFHSELHPLMPHLPALWTHNDLHASNLFWSDPGNDSHATAIIDFGLSDRTNAVHDLAHAIERNIVEWLALVGDPEAENIPVHFDHLEAMLAGYESVRLLSDLERHGLAPMTALCHAEFALSEADYFLGILHSTEKAVMAGNGWLVGHARWFHTAVGSRLLSWLREYADKHRAAGLGPC